MTLLVAVAENGAIGKDNGLLWHLPEDLKRFKRLTTGHVVVMGRKTYESIGKPLPNRTNIVVSRNAAFRAEGCLVVSSLEEALRHAAAQQPEATIFLIGGAELYRLGLPDCDRLEITEVHSAPEGDAFFGFDRTAWQEVVREHHPADERHAHAFDFVTFDRVQPAGEESVPADANASASAARTET
jgi:dihydrofolate reductase